MTILPSMTEPMLARSPLLALRWTIQCTCTLTTTYLHELDTAKCALAFKLSLWLYLGVFPPRRKVPILDPLQKVSLLHTYDFESVKVLSEANQERCKLKRLDRAGQIERPNIPLNDVDSLRTNVSEIRD